MVFSNKKGQVIFDMILVVIVLFVLAIAAVIGSYVYKELDDEIQADDDFSDVSKGVSADVQANYSTWFDNILLTVLIFLWILLIVTSFLVDAHPIFFIITVLMLIVVFIAGMAMANSYEELMLDEDLAPFAEGMPKTAFIFDNFLIILIVMGLTAALSLYAKSNI